MSCKCFLKKCRLKPDVSDGIGQGDEAADSTNSTARRGNAVLV
ncbi:hypothetical protein [Neisseria meningitidis]|nr:hypothetical protein [Neisseria meningitidis]